MMRTSLALAVVAVIAVAMVVVAHHGPIDVVIDDAAAKKAGVPFPHGAHTGLVDDCTTCHHTMETLTAETDADVQPCSACHLDPAEGVPSMRDMSLKTNPFHVNCITCHKEREAGPTTCNDCHAAA